MIATKHKAPPASNLFQKKSLDDFCGFGGWGLGYLWAKGRAMDAAVNHCPLAITAHAANHPETRHECHSVWDVDYKSLFEPGELDVATFSPDCRHFSRAKGKTPDRGGVSNKIRGLAWVLPHVFQQVGPNIAFMENVPEFLTWGPLRHARDKHTNLYLYDPRGKKVMEPDPDRKGETYRRWRRKIESLGYEMDFRILQACDYGAPTIRTRIYFIMRKDGLPIVWPAPTHGDPKSKGFAGSGLNPYAIAADCIDWDDPCPSIFLSEEEAKEQGFRVKRPLEDASLKRIARGTVKFVIESANPFLVHTAHAEEGKNGSKRWGNPFRSVHDPLNTTTGSNDMAVVAGSLFNITHTKADTGGIRSVEDPTWTITTAKGGEIALGSAVAEKLIGAGLVHIGNGEREGQAPRCMDIHEPLGTVVGSVKHGTFAAHLEHMYGQSVGSDLNEPSRSATGCGHQTLAAAFLSLLRGSCKDGQPIDQPGPTVTAGGNHEALTAARLTWIAKNYTGVVGQRADDPLGTVTSVDHNSAVSAFIEIYYSSGSGKTGSAIDVSLPTVTTQDRFAFVKVMLERDGDRIPTGFWHVWEFLLQQLGPDAPPPIVLLPDGIYLITDLGMRMLRPRELARAQGFPDSYILDPVVATIRNGKVVYKPMTITEQVKKIGNSVCPHVAAALIRANCRDCTPYIFPGPTQKKSRRVA
jgi:DNA (cytosine-5)-methyltransferase 1